MGKLTSKWYFFPAVVIIYVLLMVAFPFTIAHRIGIPLFDFRFNPFALISILVFLMNAAVIKMFISRQSKTFDNLWLILSMAALSIFALGEALQRLSALPQTAVFWAQFSGIGTSFLGAAVFLFAYNYTRPTTPNAFMSSVVLMGAAIISIFHVNYDLFFRTDPAGVQLYPWGYNNLVGPAFIANILWIFSLNILALLLIGRFKRRTPNKVLQAQARIFIWAIAVPVIGGFIFDSLLPDLHVMIFPPLSVFFSLGTTILFAVGVLRYQVFEFSPVLLSREILSTMSEAVLVVNRALQIEYVNEEAGKMLQHDPGSMMARPVDTFFSKSPVIQERLTQLRKTIEAPILEPVEDSVETSADFKKDLRILFTPVRSGRQIEGFIFVISDITSLKRANNLLAEAKANVEHTVEVRTEELRAAQAKLLEMDKMKTEFIMLSSHNLRTPLTIMRGSVELLAGNPSLTEQQKSLVASLTNGTMRLGEFIEELLDIATLEAGTAMELTPTHLQDILTPLTDEIRILAASKKLQFYSQIPNEIIVINAHASRIRGAIRNLLLNAVEFTGAGEVRLETSCSGDIVQIKISDSGTGISPEELPRLFTKFHRGTSTTQYDHDGEGLGLYLSKLVIEEHSGSIKVQSSLGKGSIFTVELPVLKSQPSPDPAHLPTETSK